MPSKKMSKVSFELGLENIEIENRPLLEICKNLHTGPSLVFKSLKRSGNIVFLRTNYLRKCVDSESSIVRASLHRPVETAPRLILKNGKPLLSDTAALSGLCALGKKWCPVELENSKQMPPLETLNLSTETKFQSKRTTCLQCSSPTTLFCEQCNWAPYCSTACQAQDTVHSVECRALVGDGLLPRVPDIKLMLKELLGEGSYGSVFEVCNRDGECGKVIKIQVLFSQSRVNAFINEVNIAHRASERGYGPQLLWGAVTSTAGLQELFVNPEKSTKVMQFLDENAEEAFGLMVQEKWEKSLDTKPSYKWCSTDSGSFKSSLESLLQKINMMHEDGIVHADLLPKNILYRVVDGKGQFAITDFGLSFRRDNAKKLNWLNTMYLYHFRESRNSTFAAVQRTDLRHVGLSDIAANPFLLDEPLRQTVLLGCPKISVKDIQQNYYLDLASILMNWSAREARRLNSAITIKLLTLASSPEFYTGPLALLQGPFKQRSVLDSELQQFKDNMDAVFNIPEGYFNGLRLDNRELELVAVHKRFGPTIDRAIDAVIFYLEDRIEGSLNTVFDQEYTTQSQGYTVTITKEGKIRSIFTIVLESIPQFQDQLLTLSSHRGMREPTPQILSSLEQSLNTKRIQEIIFVPRYQYWVWLNNSFGLTTNELFLRKDIV
jgi:serine/threonine protein kinase